MTIFQALSLFIQKLTENKDSNSKNSINKPHPFPHELKIHDHEPHHPVHDHGPKPPHLGPERPIPPKNKPHPLPHELGFYDHEPPHPVHDHGPRPPHLLPHELGFYDHEPPHPVHDHGPRPPYRGPERPIPWEKKLTTLLSILLLETIITTLLIVSGQKTLVPIFIFVITMTIIFLRPDELNEAYPAVIGAIMILFAGVVSYPNLVDITHKIGDASITIIATIVMTVILESFGFFHWAAARLTVLAKGSGYRLYWYIQLLCFLMTVLFNNDGSILITTPMLILLLRNFNLKPHPNLFLVMEVYRVTFS